MIDQNLSGVASVEETEKAQAEQQRRAAVRALQRLVFRHNWQALTLAFFSLAIASVFWGLLYLFAYWFTLIYLTVSRSFNPETLLEVNDPGLIGTRFPWWFLGGALLALITARLLGEKLRLESLRERRHYFFWVVAELAMALPNVTLSVWGNLSALVRLRRMEAAHAWHLLERVNEEGGRLSVASLRLEIEDERQLQHIVFALQLTGLVDLRERQDGWFLCLQNRDAYTLLSRAGTVD